MLRIVTALSLAILFPGLAAGQQRDTHDYWRFNREIIHERYALGVDMGTRTRTWSTAKSIAVTLIGIRADQGRLSLDEPLDIDWLPRARSPETDPRKAITLRHLLNMSSGLFTVDNAGLEYAAGSDGGPL